MATRRLNKSSIRISVLLISELSSIIQAYNCTFQPSNFLSINDNLRYSKVCCTILLPSYLYTQVLQNVRKNNEKLLVRVTRVVKDTRRIRCGRLLPSGPPWSQYFKFLNSYAFTTFFSICCSFQKRANYKKWTIGFFVHPFHIFLDFEKTLLRKICVSGIVVIYSKVNSTTNR